MKDFVAYVLRALASHPEKVSVSEVYGRQTILLEVHCHGEDMGRIIGKNGKTISALRVLLASLAAKTKHRALLEIAD